MTKAGVDVECIFVFGHVGDGELRDEPFFILHLHWQRIVFYDFESLANDAGELGRIQAMMHIFRHPGLQEAMAVISARATAVDEALVHAADFGDVGMDGNEPAIGQDKADESLGALEQAVLKITKGHGEMSVG